jgi:hypothetical protein
MERSFRSFNEMGAVFGYQFVTKQGAQSERRTLSHHHSIHSMYIVHCTRTILRLALNFKPRNVCAWAFETAVSSLPLHRRPCQSPKALSSNSGSSTKLSQHQLHALQVERGKCASPLATPRQKPLSVELLGDNLSLVVALHSQLDKLKLNSDPASTSTLPPAVTLVGANSRMSVAPDPSIEPYVVNRAWIHAVYATLPFCGVNLKTASLPSVSVVVCVCRRSFAGAYLLTTHNSKRISSTSSRNGSRKGPALER